MAWRSHGSSNLDFIRTMKRKFITETIIILLSVFEIRCFYELLEGAYLSRGTSNLDLVDQMNGKFMKRNLLFLSCVSLPIITSKFTHVQILVRRNSFILNVFRKWCHTFGKS